MNYYYHKVNQKISKYVRTVLVCDNNPGSKSSDLPLFTNGLPALLYKQKGSSHHITLFGESVPDEEWTIDDDEEITIIAFFFKPFALGTTFKLSAQELHEKPVGLNHWDAQKAIAMSTQLQQSKSTMEKVEILGHFIFKQIQNNQRDCEIIRYATDILMKHSNADVLPQLLEDLCLTKRTFQRIFKKYVGIPANKYRKICQHFIAFHHLKSNQFEKLRDVAYANGYFDQSHFIRAFKEFKELTPGEYLKSGLDLES